MSHPDPSGRPATTERRDVASIGDAVTAGLTPPTPPGPSTPAQTRDDAIAAHAAARAEYDDAYEDLRRTAMALAIIALQQFVGDHPGAAAIRLSSEYESSDGHYFLGHRFAAGDDLEQEAEDLQDELRELGVHIDALLTLFSIDDIGDGTLTRTEILALNGGALP
jgi:hypothetical protein